MKKYRLTALLLALLLLAGCLAGCSASTKAVASAANAMQDSSFYETPMEMPRADESYMTTADYDGETAAEETESTVPAEAETETDTDTAELADKMIYSAELSIQTTEFDAALAALEQSVAQIGGFVEQSGTYGDIRRNDDGTSRVVNRYANYTVRIPANRFREFLTQANGLGNVLSSDKHAENVTSQYTDYEARLSSLNTQEERLLSMLEKAEDVETLIALEERLSEVRYETESIERNLRNLDRKIQYSTVTISLEEVEVYTPTKPVQRTFGEKLGDALGDGWQSFVYGLQSFTIDLAYSLPGLILFLLIAGAVIFVALKLRRAYKAKRAAQKSAGQSADAPSKAADAQAKETENGEKRGD